MSERNQTERNSASCAVIQADTLLPPGIYGPAKGEVLLRVRWTSAPQKDTSTQGLQQAVVTWWGQRLPSKALKLDSTSERGLVYGITCGPKAFSRYLKDMQQVKVHIVIHSGKMQANAVASIGVCKLDVKAPVTSKTTVTASDGRLLGTAVVHISMSYSPLVSSFEMNEHLASVDRSMPLFPSNQRVLTPLRQLNLQSASNIQRATILSSNGKKESAEQKQPCSPPQCVATPRNSRPYLPAMPDEDKQAHMLTNLSDLLCAVERYSPVLFATFA